MCLSFYRKETKWMFWPTQYLLQLALVNKLTKLSFSFSVFQNELGVFEEQRGGHVTTMWRARGKKRTR